MLKSSSLETETDLTVICGLSSWTDTNIIVELTRSFRQLVYQHFRRARMSEEVTLKVEATKNWYAVVGDLHNQAAIVQLIEKFDHWKGFQWLCTLVLRAFPLERYRQLAIAQNANQDSRVYIELKFANRISPLKEERKMLISFGQSANGMGLNIMLRSFWETNNTIVQTANMVIWLNCLLIKLICGIYNAEHPNICLSTSSSNSSGAKSLDEFLAQLIVRCTVTSLTSKAYNIQLLSWKPRERTEYQHRSTQHVGLVSNNLVVVD